MNFIFENGFFGTRAPLFMDITTLIVSLLPLLIAFAINFARKKEYKLHKLAQVYIYIFSLIVVLFFEISVRVAGGFKGYLELSLVNKNYFTYVLIGHIILSVLMLISGAIHYLRLKEIDQSIVEMDILVLY